MPDRSRELREFKATFFKALAHPLRIQILDALRDRARAVGELAELLGVETPNVSQQLAVLRTKGIVSTHKRGNNVYYRVKDMAVFELLDVTLRIFNNHLIDMAELHQEVQFDLETAAQRDIP